MQFPAFHMLRGEGGIVSLAKSPTKGGKRKWCRCFLIFRVWTFPHWQKISLLLLPKAFDCRKSELQHLVLVQLAITLHRIRACTQLGSCNEKNALPPILMTQFLSRASLTANIPEDPGKVSIYTRPLSPFGWVK